MGEMNFLQYLAKSAKENRSILCFGLDPALERIPVKHSTELSIIKFYFDILDAIEEDSRARISAVKPNYAFFAQYGFDGLRALKVIIDKCKGKWPVILDAKRGDIGRGSEAYARECFEFWGADALTVSPFMGRDSVEPFLRYTKEGKGVYILCRTSNLGARDLQESIYPRIAQKIMKWDEEGIGAVVGATNVGELTEIARMFAHSGKKIPLLIPGVGAQGGSAKEVSSILKKIRKRDLLLHRINASSSISYAYEKKKSSDYVGAALKEIKKLNSEISL